MVKQYIDKSALVAEIEKRIKELQDLFKENEKKLDSFQKIAILLCIDECKLILNIINAIEAKNVDLEKEIQDHIKECLDIKFPTTNVEVIKKDVEYTARKFFELGLSASNKSQKEE